MGGSAGGNSNAQLFQLMQQYGGDAPRTGGEGPAVPPATTTTATPPARSHPLENGPPPGYRAPLTGAEPWPGYSGSMFNMNLLMGHNGPNHKTRPGAGGGTTTPPGTGGTGGNQFAWQFPQYTQQWAFTPPTPTPYMNPMPFDPKIFGNPLPKPKTTK